MIKFNTMDTWVVLETGGKQYKTGVGDILKIEKVAPGGEGNVTFDKILLANSDEGLIVGLPYIEKAKVRAKVESQVREDKVRVVKFKSKSRYLKRTGHRQAKTIVRVEKILL